MHLPDNDNFHIFFFQLNRCCLGLSAIFVRHSALQNVGSFYFCTKGSNLVFYIFYTNCYINEIMLGTKKMKQKNVFSL